MHFGHSDERRRFSRAARGRLTAPTTSKVYHMPSLCQGRIDAKGMARGIVILTLLALARLTSRHFLIEFLRLAARNGQRRPLSRLKVFGEKNNLSNVSADV